MTKTIDCDREKQNFLIWYELADEKAIASAKSTNIDKYRELLAKYKTEIEEIDWKKGFLSGYRATYGLPLHYTQIAILF